MMPAEVVRTRFQWRRDTAANWTSVNPVLLDGEPGLETDTGKIKYGDGVTAWNGLAYASGGTGATNLSVTARTGTSLTVASDSGTDAVIPAASGTEAGLLTATQHTKLDGIASGATANSADATLLDRANHTGTQAASTITGLATVATSGAYGDLSSLPTLGTAAATDSTAYAPAAKGVTNGDSHDHSGGDGGTIAYASLSGTPTLGTAAAQDVGTGAGDVVQLDGSARLPAVDGSQLTNLPSGATPAGTGTEIQYRDDGTLGAIPNSSVDGATGAVTLARLIAAANGAASTPPVALTGTWFTGGTSTTTKPAFLIEPVGTTSTGWSTVGTGLGVNAPSGFMGDLAWFGVNGARSAGIDSTGRISVPLGTKELPSIYPGTDTNTGIYSPGADQLAISTNGAARLLIDGNGLVGVGITSADQGLSLAVPTPGLSGDSAFGGGVATARNSFRAFEWGLRVTGESSSPLNSKCAIQYHLNPGTGGSDSEIRFVTNKYGASRGPRLTITSTGDIGFGTTTPASLLHLADAGHITVGTTTGTKIGTATNQKLGFFNATPIVQPASANQAALANSTGGTADGTLSAVGNTSTADQAAVINDNFTELFRLQNEMRTALVNLGLIKGGA